MPLIDCTGHRYNLAVQDISENDDEVIKKVSTLTSQLKCLLISAKLKQLTHLRPETRQTTLWSSVHAMLLRFVKLEEYLPQHDFVEVDA